MPTKDQALAALAVLTDYLSPSPQPQIPPQPQPEPTQPPVSADYPTGDTLIRILASLNWVWGVNEGYPDIIRDAQAMLGDVNRWNQWVNKTQEPNALITAARWRKGGVPVQAIIDQLASENQTITAEQIAQVELVMRHYLLL